MYNRGFAAYSFIIFTPLFLLVSVMTCWTLWFLNQKHQMDNLCNHYNLKAQEILLQHNNFVLSLNSKAWALILEKRSLDALILVAPPPVKVPAKIRRRFVVTKQYTLKKIQESLIHKGNIQSRMQAFALKKKFYQNYKKLERHWRSSSKKAHINIFWNKSQIKPQFKEIAPPYKRSKTHSHHQEIKVQWTIPLRSIMPLWLKNIVPIQKKWTGYCHSHPKKRRLKWIAQTGKAKL